MRSSGSNPATERTALLNSEHVDAKDIEKKHHNLAGLSVLQFRLVCVSLWSAGFLVALDSTIVATLLSDIGSYFNASNQASWLGTGYLLSLCCFTPIYGRLSDFIGRRNAHLTGLSFFTLGTILCGVAPNMYTLIAARCIAGIGGGGVASVGSIVMSDLVDLHHRGLYQGYVNIFYGLGAALGGPVGGLLSDNFGWRTAFFIQIPLLFAAGFAVFTFVKVPARDVPPPPSRNGTPLPTSVNGKPVKASLRSSLARIDYLGSATLVIAVASLLLSLSLKTSSQKSDGQDYEWSDPLIWSLFIVSAVSTVVFVLLEGLYVNEPILPLRLLTRRTPIAVALSNLFMVTNNFSIIYNIPLYFSAVKLKSSSVAGAHLLSYSLVVGLGSLSVGWMIRRTGKYYWTSICSSTCIAISSALLMLWKEESPDWLTWVAQVPAGFGYAGTLTSTLVALMTSVTREGKGETAVATSMTYMFRSIGQVLGVALSAALLQAILIRDLKESIVGPEAEKIIELIRHSTSSVKTLPEVYKQAAVAAYEHGLHLVFIANFCLSLLTIASLTLVKEEVMPIATPTKPDDAVVATENQAKMIKPIISDEEGTAKAVNLLPSTVPEDAPEHCPGTESDLAGKADACDGCPNQSICAEGPSQKGPDPDLPIIRERMSSVKRKVLVLSGKGGVGKSTFTAGLSWALAADEECQTGIMDVDICGPSIPLLMGLSKSTIHTSSSGWSPAYALDNLAVMSIGFLLPSNSDAVIWRGPKKNGLIKQFLKDVEWGDLDYLVIDTPPGTSDEHLSIVQYLKEAGIDGAVLVTTPQEVALQDVRKEIDFCRKVGIPILGLVENMSGFVCPSCREQSDIFAPTTGGAEAMGKELGIELLGRVPLDPRIGMSCDEGLSFLDEYPDSPATAAYLDIVQRIREILGDE